MFLIEHKDSQQEMKETKVDKISRGFAMPMILGSYL